MTSGSTPKPTIYPDYCHDLSPTISRWCPLRAVDVHALQTVGLFVDGKEIYHHGNHPIKWVRLTGVIVAIDDFHSRKVYTLDDSSGSCIECTCAAPIPVPAKATGNETEGLKPDKNLPQDEINVGSIVKVKGGIGTFRDVKQIEMKKIEVLGATDMEVRCWNEVLAFRRDILSKEWVVGKEEEERCRRKRMSERRGRKEKYGKRKRKDDGGRDNRKDDKRVGSRKDKEDGGETERDRKQKKRMKDGDNDGLDPVNRVNFPSLAVRRNAAGKYDALGI